MMTEEQILQMVKEYFNEGGIRDDGSCTEYYGDPDAFVKFAREMYEKGYDEGTDDAYDREFRIKNQIRD
jgi:hypothetical protein